MFDLMGQDYDCRESVGGAEYYSVSNQGWGDNREERW